MPDSQDRNLTKKVPERNGPAFRPRPTIWTRRRPTTEAARLRPGTALESLSLSRCGPGHLKVPTTGLGLVDGPDSEHLGGTHHDRPADGG